jgi:3-oxoacyl-[acyl-carrier-protein] synthase-3
MTTASELRQHRSADPVGATSPTREQVRRERPLRPAGIIGIGGALPRHEIGNAELAERLSTTNEWIVRRTGIRSRRWLDEGQPLAEIAAEAALAALSDAGATPADVDVVIVSTITADRVTPGAAIDVAQRIGAGAVSAFDVNAACAGFIYALDQACAMVETGRADLVLVVGAEALSRLTDHEDRGTAVLFGDGAGAVVVAAAEGPRGCAGFVLSSDAAHSELLYADVDDRELHMEGREVYRHAVARMVEVTNEALRRSGLTADDLDVLVAHQANGRIIESAASRLGIPPEKAIIHLDRVANTSSASIPLALWQAEREGRLEPGMTVGLVAFGAGFVWGAGVLGWKEAAHAGS